jgi:predicted transcriptional regulator
MFLPNPIEIPVEFWKEYRKVKLPHQRLELAKKYKLLTDEAILILRYLVLDIDSPFEEVLPVWNKLKEELGIERYAIYRTKSGQFRAYIYLKPTFIEKDKEITFILNGEEKKKTITQTYIFYLRPHTKAKNGHTHLENARELLHIIYAFFEKHGLKADRTFPNRINHPIWVEGWSIKGKRSELVEEGLGQAIRLYDLYRRTKELQKRYGLWTFGNINLTEKFWGKGESQDKSQKEGKLIVPKFVAQKVANELDDLIRWKLAVKKLAEKYTTYRFTKVMMPAVGWAKDLGLDKREVYDYLRDLLPDKRNFDEDFEKAWKYADCRFEWKANESKGKEQENLIVELLKACQRPTSRQELIAKVFHGQVWLFEEATQKALKAGLLQVEKVKLKQGKGRKSHVYALTDKGRAFLESWQTNPRESLAMVVGLESMEGKGLQKNLYITPFREQRSGQDTVVGSPPSLSMPHADRMDLSPSCTQTEEKISLCLCAEKFSFAQTETKKEEPQTKNDEEVERREEEENKTKDSRETERKKKHFGLKSAKRLIDTLIEKTEKLTQELEQGQTEDALKRVAKLVERLEKAKDRLKASIEEREKRKLEHDAGLLARLLELLDDFSREVFDLPVILPRKEKDKLITLLDKAVYKYEQVLEQKGNRVTLERDFRRIAQAFLETYAYAIQLPIPRRPDVVRFLREFILWRHDFITMNRRTGAFRNYCGEWRTMAEITRLVQRFLDRAG